MPTHRSEGGPSNVVAELRQSELADTSWQSADAAIEWHELFQHGIPGDEGQLHNEVFLRGAEAELAAVEVLRAERGCLEEVDVDEVVGSRNAEDVFRLVVGVVLEESHSLGLKIPHIGEDEADEVGRCLVASSDMKALVHHVSKRVDVVDLLFDFFWRLALRHVIVRLKQCL